ncbi:hypothetical protein DMUE_1081 [Dictyocoela muelleri]|nr:hypothetical protein DMUE_1081 [Dictyocoela muelleri]
MKSKSQKSYTEAFRKIFTFLKKGPDVFIIDFEIAVFNSIKTIFPNTKINGCNFHFNQLIVNFLKKNQLIGIYKVNEKFRKFVKYLLILSYVPKEKIEVEFEKIIAIKEDNNIYDIIIKYFKLNFIENFDNKIKNKDFWNVYDRVKENIPTTTNSCEAYHRHINSKISRKNMNLVRVIEILKQEERRLKLKIQKLKSATFQSDEKNV